MIVVTGATSTVGQLLVRTLHARGSDARALVRSKARARELLGPTVPLEQGDLTDADSLVLAFRGVEAVFILMPLTPRLVQETRNVVQAARRAGVTRVVKLSGLGAGPHATHVATRLHGEADALLAGSGLEVTLLRSNVQLQSLRLHAARVRRTGAVFSPLGSAKVSFVDARDVAEVAAAVLGDARHAGRCYDLTGPQALSYGELADILGTVLACRIRYVRVPLVAVRLALQAAGRDPWRAAALTDLFAALRRGEGAVVSPDVSAVLGRQPCTFAQFVREGTPSF